MQEKIAFAALIVSIATAFFTFFALYQNRKINITNLEAKHFEEIFTKYIVTKIPDAVEDIEFRNDGKLQGYNDLIDTLMDMMCDCKYYAYAKHDFYQELKGKCIALEDRLLETANGVISDSDLQAQFVYEIHLDLMQIIKLINKNYHSF